ncbi:MAG: carboxypeptidase regulatory-like domain-containing protein, partial [Acidobacteria bacterium]|nr:carboxypeptidase regulatory-like domain-containing protein [Acidobacteriota bacterium]
MPGSLAGCGRVELALIIDGVGLSNSVIINVGAVRGPVPPSVTSFSDALVKVGDAIAINGSGFDLQTALNTVIIGGKTAQVDLASLTQLVVRVPYGVGGGEVSVKTSRGEAVSRPRRPNSIRLRTSLSGLVEDTDGRPVRGLRVELSDKPISPTITNDQGVFIFANLDPGNYNLKFNSEASLLPFPNFTASKNRVEANKDTHYRKMDLQRISGQSYQVTGGTGQSLVSDVTTQPLVKLEEQGLIFEFQANTVITFPGGTTSGRLTLSRIKNSLTPAPLPPGQFSRAVAQLTSTAATLNPGGKLTFPNEDGYQPGISVDLYRLDQTPGSPNIGTFVKEGTAIVSADGQRIETGPNAIKEATVYLVSNTRPTTTVIGRVVTAGDNLPVIDAQVRTRGQLALTDGNGSFILRDVQTGPGDTLSVEAVYVRPDGRVSRARPVLVSSVVGGTTTLPSPLVLETEAGNRPPVISIESASIRVNAGETKEAPFFCYDPDGPQPRPTLSPLRSWTRVADKGEGKWSLVISPPASEEGSTRYVRLAAVDGQGGQTELDLEIKINGRPIPGRFSSALNTEQNTPLRIILSGSDPDNDPISYLIVASPANGNVSRNGSE